MLASGLYLVRDSAPLAGRRLRVSTASYETLPKGATRRRERRRHRANRAAPAARNHRVSRPEYLPQCEVSIRDSRVRQTVILFTKRRRGSCIGKYREVNAGVAVGPGVDQVPHPPYTRRLSSSYSRSICSLCTEAFLANLPRIRVAALM